MFKLCYLNFRQIVPTSRGGYVVRYVLEKQTLYKLKSISIILHFLPLVSNCKSKESSTFFHTSRVNAANSRDLATQMSILLITLFSFRPSTCSACVWSLDMRQTCPNQFHFRPVAAAFWQWLPFVFWCAIYCSARGLKLLFPRYRAPLLDDIPRARTFNDPYNIHVSILISNQIKNSYIS